MSNRSFAVRLREKANANIMGLNEGEFLISDEAAASILRIIAQDTEIFLKTEYPFKLVHPDD